MGVHLATKVGFDAWSHYCATASVLTVTPALPRLLAALITMAHRYNSGVSVSATASIPLVYRLILTIIEPSLAAYGALLAICYPDQYLSAATRNSASFTASTTFLYTALGGGWLYFAFNEAIVLRLFDDLRLWRIICMGMLLSDAAYCHSVAQAVGGWDTWCRMGSWSIEDWFVFWTTAPMVSVRILIVFGVGVKHQ